MEDKIKYICDNLFNDEFNSSFILNITEDKEKTTALKYIDFHYSLMISNAMNVLVCSCGDLKFLVFQHVSSADFIYFHDIGFKFYCHVNNDIAKSSLDKFESMSNDLFEEHKKNLTFGGIIASHGRPAHFFYDTALGIENLCSSGNLSRIKDIYQIEGANFQSIIKLYKIEANEHVTNYIKLNEISNLKKLLFFKVGGFYGFGNEFKRKALQYFDLNFLEFSKKITNKLVEKILEYKSKDCYVVWHGITTDKRKWVEQEDAIVEFVTQLSKRGKKVLLIVDGWTSPLTPTNFDKHQIVMDEEVYKNITKKIGKIANVESVIGYTPDVKLRVASLVDFHISNGGTGSLYTSRIAKKAGLLHIATRSRKMCGQSIHYNSSFVPEKIVIDIPNEEFDRDDYVSYSIDPQNFTNFALMNLNKGYDVCNRVKEVINCGVGNNFDYISKNNDPIIIFDIDNLFNGNRGIIEVNVSLSSNIELKSANAKFYFDYGDGFNELNSDKAIYSNGVFSIKKSFTRPITALRFDPFEEIGEFTIEKVIFNVEEM